MFLSSPNNEFINDDLPTLGLPTIAILGRSYTNPHLKIKQDTLYVPTQNGLYKKSVTAVDTLWQSGGFTGMLINDYAFIGTDTIICLVDSTEGNTVFISTDNGNTYYNSTNGFGGSGINFTQGYRLDVNPDNHNEIIAQSGACIAKSIDFGLTWNQLYLSWGYLPTKL